MENITGLVVRSKAGRDKGNRFVVLSYENGYAYVADGELRRVERPKKKKLRHLQLTGYVCEAILNRINSDDEVANCDVRKALAEYSEN